ncbi:MAG: four-carbon acid sugar kinase family protein [Pirellula sp.]
MIVVIADDLSGAAELACIAVQHGLTAEVQTRFDPNGRSDVIAIDTKTRAGTPDQAAETIRNVTAQVARAMPTWIYKKTDSVFRGNPRAEILTMLACLDKSECIYVPANPSMARTIVDGRYYIDGVPLHETEFGFDPCHPMKTNVIDEIMPPTPCIRIPNIASLRDMPNHIGNALPAGGSDFFASLLDSLPSRTTRCSPLSEYVLFVCGSHHAWRNHRNSEMTERGFLVVDGKTAMPDGAWQNNKRIMLAVGEIGCDDRDECLTQLIQRAIRLALEKPTALILLEGGETARAFVDAMKWSRFEAINTGIRGAACFSTPSGSIIAFKPGSYPWPKELFLYGER